MSARIILPLPGGEALAATLAARLAAPAAVVDTRPFPDGETYLRLPDGLAGREVTLVANLARPDDQFLRLVFAARTARGLGAARLTLVVPYLPYMRQDMAFHHGEAVTSAQFASLISREVDALVTVDPHLHRWKALSEIYAIPAEALHAAPLLADWIARNVELPFILGPDQESRQWAAEVAAHADAPFAVITKDRRGDRDVSLDFPDLSGATGRTPVLIDDIAASGETLIAAAKGLAELGLPKPVCVVVHALFVGDSYERLSKLARTVVSANTAPHLSNRIDVTGLIAGWLNRP